MYGLVNQAVEELIRERHGAEVWGQVKARAGVTEEVFLSMAAYPDDVTFRLVGAASEVLQVPAAALLEAFGEYWTLYTGRQGYGAMFKHGGSTFAEFMGNLHALHSHVAVSFPDLQPPSFWCTDEGAGYLRLHYQSTRQGLAPMVVGLVKGLGAMFATPVRVVHVASAGTQGHDEFDVWFGPGVEA